MADCFFHGPSFGGECSECKRTTTHCTCGKVGSVDQLVFECKENTCRQVAAPSALTGNDGASK